jgi:tRNA(fMet)-specific endonuclease VapC
VALRLAIDTNRYSDLARGDAMAVELLETADEIFLPFIVLAELRAGFLGGTRARKNEMWLARFREKYNVQALMPDEITTGLYATVHRQLRAQGTPIPSNDIWIAALTLQHGLTLYARDAHFDHLPQLSRI